MTSATRQSGLPLIGRVPWGAHLCHFYATRDDLADVLAPYFLAGITANERCLWITSEPFPADDAWACLRALLPRLDDHVERGQIEIIDHRDWYTRNGAMGTDEIIRGWLDREREARARGFAGLRLSGNTFWLERPHWKDFAEYEARVHRAFHDRRIIALCSYSLERCGADEVVDVLRNHGTALVRRGGAWEVIHSATTMLAAMAADEGPRRRSATEPPTHPRHEVHLYRERAFLTQRVVSYAEEGLRAGQGVLLLNTHLTPGEILAALAERGIDSARCLAEGQLLLPDAGTVLERSLVNGRIDASAFEASTRALLDPLAARYPEIRVYGDLVDLLLRRGDPEAALTVEGCWNRLQAVRDFPVLCGYGLESLSSGADTATFARICDAHAHVAPAEDAGGHTAARPPGHLIAALQHQGSRLAQESRLRQELDGERDRLTRHLAHLQRVTSALSGAAAPEDIASVVGHELATAVGADRCALAVLAPAETGDQLRLLEPADDAPAPLRPLLEAACRGRHAWHPTRADIDRELSRAGLAPPPAWHCQALACLPLVAGDRVVGALGLTWSEPHVFAAADRALVDDLARQIGLALDRALLFQRCEQERTRAEEANRAKDEFLAMLGHELRNPLSPMVTALELIRLRGTGAAIERERHILERQVRNLVRLVDDLLDVSRVTRGKIHLEKQRIEAAGVIGKAVEMASPVLEARTHTLTVDAPAEGLTLDADESRLAQVLANLLINAARYTPPRGHITVRAAHEGDQVLFSVRDNGAGIDPALLPRLFEAFVQGARSPDRSEGGLGLGLAIAQSLVRLHGGTIAARSDGVGRGAEFIVRLPAARTRLPETTRPAAPASPAPSCQVRRVLVIDDNRDAADNLAHGLRLCGHEVEVAYDGPTALSAAQAFRPEVALVDIGLPVLDGYEVAARLRAGAEARPPRLIAVTGYGQAADRARAEAAGFELLLVKPVPLRRIQAVVAG